MSDYFSSGSAHFYDCRGGQILPAYDAGLREARVRNLYASPTTVNGDVRKNFGLDRWKQGLLVDTVMQNPQMADEELDAYKKRIGELVRVPASTASDFGTLLHNALEHSPSYPADESLHPWLREYGKWHDENVREVIANEMMVAHHGIGIAGKTDLICVLKDGRTAVVDYKTTEFKPKKTGDNLFYKSWSWQLAFYAEAYRQQVGLMERPVCISLAINSKNLEPPKPREWSLERIEIAWKSFAMHAWLWSDDQGREGYWPVGRWEINDILANQ